jgi:hypothetical protein
VVTQLTPPSGLVEGKVWAVHVEPLVVAYGAPACAGVLEMAKQVVLVGQLTPAN